MNAVPAEAPAKADPTDLPALDFEIGCASPGCSAHATWWSRCVRCNAHVPVCNEHRARALESARRSTSVGCASCDVWVKDWRRLFEWIPIEGA